MVKTEESHLNEFYRTKQKVKRDLDARELREKEIQNEKLSYKSELEKELKEFYE